MSEQLSLDGPGVVSNIAPDTSLAAATGNLSRSRMNALRFFVEHPGSTVDDMAVAGVMPSQSGSARVNELAGLNGKFNDDHPGFSPVLEYLSETKLTQWGKKAHVVGVTAQGQIVYGSAL